MHSEYKQLFTDSYSNYFSDKMQYYITAIVPNSINCLHHYSSFYFPCFIALLKTVKFVNRDVNQRLTSFNPVFEFSSDF